MTEPLLETKLYIPPVRPNLLPRPRLVDQLARGMDRQLTLLSAPAGYGKTSLLSQWVATMNRPVAWVSLDKTDNDPPRFLRYVAAACSRALPALASELDALPDDNQAALIGLINALTQAQEPLALVLDDYHLIQTLSIHRLTAFLIAHQPPALHLIIATREDPLLPLARLRARGQLQELRQDALGFTLDETDAVLGHVTDLTPSQVRAVQERTEGWPAGLQLAAMSLTAQGDAQDLLRHMSGDNRYILDYLLEEVFRQQTEMVQRFLQQTAILDRLCGDLCDALTGDQNGASTLHELEAQNAFLLPLDQRRRWYRYHHLFADLLRHRLQRQAAPEAIAALHCAACNWLRDHDLISEAIPHALASQDWKQAATLINGQAEAMLKRGEMATLARWYDALPPHIVGTDPELCLNHGWVLTLLDRLEQAEPLLDQAEALAPHAGPAQNTILGEAAIVRTMIARTRGQAAQTIDQARQARSLLPQLDPMRRSLLALSAGMAQVSQSHLDDAEQELRQAHRDATVVGNPYVQHTATNFRTRVQIARGHFEQALATAEGLLHQPAAHVPAAARALAQLNAALIHWERGEQEATQRLLSQAQALAQEQSGAELLVSVWRLTALARASQQDATGAGQALTEAEQIAHERRLPPIILARLAAFGLRAALWLGDEAGAATWAHPLSQWEQDSSDQEIGLAYQAWLARYGDRNGAREQLEMLVTRWDAAGAAYLGLRGRLWLAQVVGTARRDKLLTEALNLGHGMGALMSWLEAGETVTSWLRTIDPSDYVKRILAATGPMPMATVPATANQALVEPLSDRELEVLQVLAQGGTNQAIADQLYVSTNTIKTHLKNIYEKLGVSNRRAAVTQARELDLLSGD